MRAYWRSAIAKALEGQAFDRREIERRFAAMGIREEIVPGENACSAPQWRALSRKVIGAGIQSHVYRATTHAIAGTDLLLLVIDRPRLTTFFHISQTELIENAPWPVVLRDPRIAAFAGRLRAMSREAGWAEVGGSIIRKSEDYRSHDYQVIVGRTTWVPFAEWYQRMQQSDAQMPGGRPGVELAVNKAVAGEALTTQQRRTVLWMLAECECPEGQWQEQQRQEWQEET